MIIWHNLILSMIQENSVMCHVLSGQMRKPHQCPKSSEGCGQVLIQNKFVFTFWCDGSALDHPCHQRLRMSYGGLPTSPTLPDRQGFFPHSPPPSLPLPTSAFGSDLEKNHQPLSPLATVLVVTILNAQFHKNPHMS